MKSEAVREQRLRVDGRLLAVQQRGDAAAPTVLLVHGYPDDHTVWSAVAQRLSAQHRVVSYDVRGAGQSWRPRQRADYRLPLLARDMAAVAHAVAPGQRVHLVGHDWGSMQGWEAVSGADAAATFASFTSVSGPCLDHVGDWLRTGLRQRDAGALQLLLRQVAHSWYIGAMHLPLLAGLAWKAGLGRAWPAVLARLDGATAVARTAQTHDGASGVDLYRANVLARLARPRTRPVHIPVQVLIARDDPFVSATFLNAVLEHAAPRVPQLVRYTLRGGHWLPLSQPQAVADRIAAWVAATHRA